MDELLKRINELFNKSKTVDLTNEEKEEQKRLRQEYLKLFRGQMKNDLDNVVIVSELQINKNKITNIDKIDILKKNDNIVNVINNEKDIVISYKDQHITKEEIFNILEMGI